MRFLVDEQLPAALASWLAERGVAADHVDGIGLSGLSDRAIWNHASQTGAVIITKDEDFVYLQTISPSGPAIVWVRLGNARTKVLLASFEARFERVLALLRSGERLVELR